MRKNNDWQDATKVWKHAPYSYSNAIKSWVSRVITNVEVFFWLIALCFVSFCCGLGVAYWIMKDLIC